MARAARLGEFLRALDGWPERDIEEFARLLFAEMPADELDGMVRGIDSVLTVLREVVPEAGPKDA